MDVAEQALQALEMLSKKHNKAILHAVSYAYIWQTYCMQRIVYMQPPLFLVLALML
jgi:hypothetical protein